MRKHSETTAKRGVRGVPRLTKVVPKSSAGDEKRPAGLQMSSRNQQNVIGKQPRGHQNVIRTLTKYIRKSSEPIQKAGDAKRPAGLQNVISKSTKRHRKTTPRSLKCHPNVNEIHPEVIRSHPESDLQVPRRADLRKHSENKGQMGGPRCPKTPQSRPKVFRR